MKYEFIAEHQGQFAITICCEVLRVSRSGYYDWRNRKPSRQALSNRDLDARITALFAQHKQRAGSPRITQDLRAENFSCSENRVARRMKHLGLHALAKRKYKVRLTLTTINHFTIMCSIEILQRVVLIKNGHKILPTFTLKKVGYILRW